MDENKGIKLKHILHLYESVESSLVEVLIEKTDPKYRKEIQDKAILARVIKANARHLNLVRQALARLCIR